MYFEFFRATVENKLKFTSVFNEFSFGSQARPQRVWQDKKMCSEDTHGFKVEEMIPCCMFETYEYWNHFTQQNF